MALEYGFFDSMITGYDDENMPIFDRAQSSDFLALFFSKLITSGVCAEPNTNFQVTASSGMTVQIAPGFGYVEGRFARDEEIAYLTLDAAPTSGSRIDMIVLRNNYPDRCCEIVVKSGTAASSPKEPTLIQDEGSDYYELCLAKIKIASGTTTVTNSMITDTRWDSEYCGAVTQLIDHLDTSEFFEQLYAFYDEYVSSATEKQDEIENNFQTQFSEWFEQIKGQLSEDAAGNLQNQIDNIQTVKFATCNNSPSEAAKTVTCSDFVLGNNARIAVLFTMYNSAENMTLNVNGTGDYPVYSASGSGTHNTRCFGVGSIVEFLFRGSFWQILSISHEGSGLASGVLSHAEGDETTASGNYGSHAEGYMSIASGSYSSHAEGGETTASGNWGSHAEGHQTTASGSSSHAEGFNTIAKSAYCHAEGYSSTADGGYSHAEGAYTTATGICSHAEGYYAVSSGDYSHAEGYQTFAGKLVHVEGHYNSNITSIGNYNNTTGTGFVIGNGTSDDERNNAFRVDYSGAVYGAGAYNSSGADYAEYVKEWADGNPNAEDRVGYFVTLKNSKLEKANAGDYILGITSGNPSIIGNGDESYYWKYERDEFNRIVWEDCPEIKTEIDENGNAQEIETGEIIKNGRMKLAADYDPTQEYVQRKDRPEWDYVGMVGVLPVRDDGSCIAGEFCKCGADGIAIHADAWGFGTYLVIERISDNVISVVLK